MKQETSKKLKDMAQKYKKHGVTLQDCINLFNMSMPIHNDEDKTILYLRVTMAERFGEHEYFTSEDVAILTGQTVEQVNKHIEDNKEELMNNGHIVEVSSSIPGLFDK